MKSVVGSASVLVAVCLSSLPSAQARDLAFEDRVRAQEAIERVYYSHQIGAAKFEEAVPRAVLEKKVRTYLKQSVALEKFWKTPVTSEMLHREMERMARGSRMPERLRELYAALGNDPLMIQECLARATLVDRLTRNFFTYDDGIHEEERHTAEALRDRLVNRQIDPYSEHRNRTIVDLVRVDQEEKSGESPKTEPSRLELSPEDFEWWQARLPKEIGAIGSLSDERGAFDTRVILERDASRLRVATFAVRKRAWQDWWSHVEGTLDETSVHALAPSEGPKPNPSLRPRDERRLETSALVVPSGEGLLEDSSCVPDDTWDNGSLDDLPDPRSNATAVWTGSVMIVWGGGYPSINRGGRYDPATDSWTPTSIVDAPAGRRYHTAVWTGDLMIVWGGSGGADDAYLNTGGRYDPATDSWTPTSTVGAPDERASHTAVWTGNLMVLWGGYYYEDGSHYLNSGGRYDPETDSWTPTSIVDGPPGRFNHTAVWTGSVMVVWGGDDGFERNTGGQYDPSTDTWRRTSTTEAPVARSGHTVVWTGTEMIVWGGHDVSFTYLNSGGRYDPEMNRWRPTATIDAPQSRLYHTAVWTGSEMVVWGGLFYDGEIYILNNGGRYDPETDRWTPTSLADAPQGRTSHTAVWAGNLMVVWGGDDLNTGGRYDPATDTWTPTATAGAPAKRLDHTAIWTGSHMIVWGGIDGSTYADPMNTGGRYDPATDSWAETSTAGAPSPRSEHTAVWTGDLMVVWGGNDGSTDLDTGGRYDPAANVWTPTSIVGVPAARRGHTVVWTGSVMVVWGGFYSLNTGGRYDLATDSWAPTSETGAPLGRWLHTAVWTGREMLVWGGAGSEILRAGGAYDPVRDRWRAITRRNGPTPRDYHSAVWTGSHMVIWGGRENSQDTNTGARYDPLTRSWAPTSTVGAPEGRWGHSAVWTGSRMVVWGGSIPGGGHVDTGGRYDPSTDSWLPTSSLNVPSARRDHAAVWTGSMMIIWGGTGNLSTSSGGGRYALDQSVDNDGDGISECNGDCDDTDPAIHPGAVDVCDGWDNNCDGAIDEGCGM